MSALQSEMIAVVQRDDWHWRMPVKVRWSDLDPLGHVHHLTYLRWCEDARNEHAVAIGLPSPGIGEKSQVLVRITCDYVKPILRDEQGHVYLRVTSVGGSSLETEFVIITDHVCFKASIVSVMCSDVTGKPVTWNKTERANLITRPDALN